MKSNQTELILEENPHQIITNNKFNIYGSVFAKGNSKPNEFRDIIIAHTYLMNGLHKE